MTEQESKGWRNDAYANVTGTRRQYMDDLKFSNVLHAAPVYSDCVHAKIESIMTGDAENYPGVVRVFTARDVPGANHCGQIIQDYRIFADDKIRYQRRRRGHGRGGIARHCHPRLQALVRVKATPLPAVLDPEQAMGRGSRPCPHEPRKQHP